MFKKLQVVNNFSWPVILFFPSMSDSAHQPIYMLYFVSMRTEIVLQSNAKSSGTHNKYSVVDEYSNALKSCPIGSHIYIETITLYLKDFSKYVSKRLC